MRALLDLLVPSRCAGCGRDGPALCPACWALLGPPEPVRVAGVLPPVYALGRYAGPLRSALLAYKERGRRELAAQFGAALAGGIRALNPAAGGVWLVPAPSRSAAARSRGGDHARRLAERAAAALAAGGMPAAVAPAIRLAPGARDSVGLDAAARAANLAGRIRPRLAGLPPPGTSVVLIDDVVTTGATASACTAALSAARVDVHAVLVLASASKLRRSGDIRNHSVTARVTGVNEPPTIGAGGVACAVRELRSRLTDPAVPPRDLPTAAGGPGRRDRPMTLASEAGSGAAPVRYIGFCPVA